MTVIVYRDGVLAADTRSTIGDGRTIMPGVVVKIVPLDRLGALAAGAVGRSSFLQRFLNWAAVDFSAPPPVFPDETCVGLVVESAAAIRLYSSAVRDGVIWPTEPFQAFGSGAQAALGAMWAGASAEEAVHAACQVDAGCGLPVRALRIIKLNMAPDAAMREIGGGA